MGNGPNSECLEWDSGLRLQVTSLTDQHAECYRIQWEPYGVNSASPYDCYDVADAHWYGGAEVRRDHWTIQKQPMAMQPFLPSDFLQYSGAYGSVMERYWLSSKGVAIFVKDTVPLHVSVDSKRLCFKAEYANSWYQNPSDHKPKLDYKICTGQNVKAIHQYMAFQNWERPQGIPDVHMFRLAIWSTWARYKTDINQKKVLEFADEITQHHFKGCQIEIDDMYTPTYGDLIFDKQKFPDPLTMARNLRLLGFRVTSWVVPFANMDSQAFADGLEYSMFVKSPNEDVPALTRWWQGTGALLDVTNPAAVKWFKKRLDRLREQGVNSFKFDAGEINWFPPGSRTHRPLKSVHHYTHEYAQTAYEVSDNLAEVRAVYKNQNLPIFVRMLDKISKWDYDLGLRTLIPTALTMGLIGYPFILPDMVGGNGYGPDSDLYTTVLPEKELYIRWMQVTAFMPAVQFSIVPWDYDKETVDICRQYMELHQNYVAPRMIKLARQAVASGSPMIRPMWWAEPENPVTFDIDNQFMIGDDVVVAPILHKGATKRDIYLPRGKWKDMIAGRRKDVILDGGRWLWEYEATLDQIPFFELVL